MRWSRLTKLIAAAPCWLLLWAVAGAAALVAPGAAAAPADIAEEDSVEEPRELLEPDELEALVGPVALYPDDLLAIVLPASRYPLQIVQAARYLEALEDDPSLEPDEDWDESVVALLNYPEVLAKLNEDLDWTSALGQAVMDQEQELLAAVDQFRREAYAAGNLASDRRQRVEVDDYAVRILRTDPSVIYIPHYESALVRARHSDRVYHYYPRPCPVYYYPYPAGHYLASRHFWGMTGAFSIGWQSRHLDFHLLQHRSHPYFGHGYSFRHYRYWRPRLLDHDHARIRHRDRYEAGNRWRRGHRDQYDVPFTRPPAAAALPQLHRYQDDGDKSSRIYRARGDSAARAAERAAGRAESRMRYDTLRGRTERQMSRSVRTAPQAESSRSVRIRSSRATEPRISRGDSRGKASAVRRGSYDPR